MSDRYTGRSTPALTHLCAVAEALGPLVDRVVFIGGAIAPLLKTHPISPRVRPTKDVNGMAITTSYRDFHRLQDDLRRRGFQQRAIEAEATTHAHRWTTPGGGVFDLVPAGTHLGASGNPLDRIAIESAESVHIERPGAAPLVVRHASAPSFLGLKWAAYQDRGEGDLFGSHDIEDILAVLASRPAVEQECAAISEPRLRVAIAAMAQTLSADDETLGELLAANVVVDNGKDAHAVHRQIRTVLQRLALLAEAP